MSNINSLPTAVVSPLKSVKALNQDEDSNLIYASSYCAGWRNKETEKIPNSMHSSRNSSAEVDHALNKNGQETISSSQNILEISPVTNCTVELTKFNNLNSYKNGQNAPKILSFQGGNQSVNNTFAKRSKISNCNDEKACDKSLHKTKRKRLLTQKSSKVLPTVKAKQGGKSLDLMKKNAKKVSCQNNTGCSQFSRRKSQRSNTPSNDGLWTATCEESLFTKHSLSSLELSDILQRFSSGITVCSLCHLPAHFLPGLGDLFGPYRPSYDELLERYESAQKSFVLKQTCKLKRDFSDNKQEVCIDQTNKTCFISTACFTSKSNDRTGEEFCLESTSQSENAVRSLVPRLRMFQTVDCILTESGRKPAAKFSRHTKSMRIPGFTGRITTTDQNCTVHPDSSRTLLHDMNTIVFVEPTLACSHSNDQRSSNASTSTDDQTSIDVVHKFDVSPIWIHGPCAIWTPGVYCIHGEVRGLSNAVRQAAEIKCDYCQQPGASIPCQFKKNTSFHYLCCLAKGLRLDETSFMAVEHKPLSATTK